MASLSLVVYLARGEQATGTAIAWLVAAPSLAGLLRLATPYWLHRVRSRRAFCMAFFLASAAALAVVPASLRVPALDPVAGLWVLAAAWTTCQVLEQCGVVALWSWLGDLAPRAVRGRFLARREAWMLAGIVLGGAVAVALTGLGSTRPADAMARRVERRAYLACAAGGAGVLALAVAPLAWMAETTRRAPRPRRPALRDLWTPLADRRFRRLLAFGLWFSLANGLVQTAQNLFLIHVGLSLGAKKALDGGTRALQAVVLPSVGRAVDRRGNVPVLAVAQGIVACSTLFFLAATPATPWWVVGAYACWIGYAGLNVALPNLMLALAPEDGTPSYAAAWFAWTQLAYALSVLAGGRLFDGLAARGSAGLGGMPVDQFAGMFIGAWALRAAGVGLALRLAERRDASGD